MDSVAKRIFSQFTIPVTSNHKWGAPHLDYNEAVWEKWEDFKKANKISDSTCSKAQAKKFLSQVMKSKDTRIAGLFTWP